MSGHLSNIETVARAICEHQYRKRDASDPSRFDAHVDRYWHCIAAELEAGLNDEIGNPRVEFDHAVSITAYRDWRSRHPEYTVPDHLLDRSR